MKKILLLVTVLIGFTACQNEVRYTQKSTEIDAVKQHVQNYNDQNYELSLLADNSMSFFNTKTDSLSKSELVAYHQANDANYSSRGFLEEDQEYEMVVTDDGETWVNAWLDWSGTVKGSDKTIVMPIHLTYKFEDGKIVRELGYWDPTEVMDEAEAVAAMSAAGSGSSDGGDRATVSEVSSIDKAPASSMSESSKADTDALTATIASRLRNPGFPVDDNSKASIRLTVNSANQIVVLGVESSSNDVKEFVVKKLNYHQLDFDFADKLKVYSVPVTIVAD